MKIVDSFLFSEIFEKELLLLKFVLEDSCVDEWILLENAYSFQGDFKGLQAKYLLNSDDRFKPYLHKVTIISEERATAVLSKDEVLDNEAFKIEYWQRDLAYNHFMSKYSDEDWIIICDVDESLDFSDVSRRTELLHRMKADKQGILHVSTKRYWYDFDNDYQPLYGIPMCSKTYLQATGKKLHHVRIDYHADLKMKWNNIIGFEYSSCFNIEEIYRKLATNSHMAVKMDELKQALRCNHRPISKARRMEIKNNRRFFFETVELTEANSPQYVRENIAWLKTYNVDLNYEDNRYNDYAEIFTTRYLLKQRLKEKTKDAQTKFRQLLRILKLEKLVYD